MKRHILTLLLFLPILFLTLEVRAGNAVYLPFTIKGGSDQTTKFNDSIVASSDAHWGWTYRWWTETHKTNWLGIPYGYKWTLHSETRHDGIVLGGKTTNSNSTFHTTSNDNGSAGWEDKYIIIESKEVVKSVTLATVVYDETLLPSTKIGGRKLFWSIYLTNDVNNWGDQLWDSGNDKEFSEKTIDLSEKVNYTPANKYIVICFSGNYSGCITKLVINENTYFNITSTPDDYSVYIGEYQTQDIAVDFSNLDGINNTGITEFTVTSTDTAFKCQSQSGDPLGLLKSGQHQIAIRFYPENDKVPTKHETTITIKAGTKSNSLKKTINLIGYSYKPQTIIWNQNFSRLDISDADTLLTATSSVGLTPIVYTSNDPSIVTIINGKLHIVGKGRTTITASQAGRDGYSPATKTKYVYVSEPGDPCETYDLYEPDHVTLHTIDAEVYELFGLPADKLTFDACRTIDAITSSFGNQYFWVAESTDGGKNFHDIRYIDDMPRSEALGIIGTYSGAWKNYTVQLSENATHVKIYTKAGVTLRHHIRNVIVTQKQYIRTNPDSIKLTPEVGSSNYSSTVRVSYSALKENLRASFETSTSQFTLDHTNIPVGCGETDIVDIKISMPNVSCNELRNYLVLTDGTTTVKVPIIVTPQKGFQQINWFDSNVPTGVNTSSELTVADMGAYVAPRNIQPVYTSDNPEIADFDAYGNLVIKQPGNVTIRASRAEEECYKAADDVTKTITIAQAYLTFDDKSKDKNWFNANNWKPNRNVIPNHLAFATLEADVEVSDQAFAKKLMLDGHGVTVKADGSLHAETIVGADTPEPRIILEAGNETKAPGALATKSDNVKANVGIYVKSTTQAENTTWQYMGVPFSVRTVPAFYGAWICEWSEAVGNWSYKTTNDVLEPWKGYCITQPELTMTYGYEINGVVQNSNHTYELTYTESSKYAGDNLMTNSYTAPIDITKLNAEDFVNADKTIYIFNTGSYEQWEDQKAAKGKDLKLAGQYMAIPILEADYTPYGITVIPAMQAFNVHATAENASFTVDYNRAVWGSKATTKPKRAPRRSPADELYDFDENIIIEVHGSRFSDAISVLKRSSCTNAFDNGHDAYKWDGDNSAAPQLFSTEDDEKIYTIDARPELEGHYIGFKGGEDSEYTLYFKLAETDEQYYLKDLADNSYYLIVEGTSVTIDAKEPMNRRFQIVSEISAEDIPQEHTGVTTDLSMNSDMAFLTNNTDYSVYANIYDMSGKLIHQPLVAPHSTLNYELNNLPRGTYIINLGSQNIKVVR